MSNENELLIGLLAVQNGFLPSEKLIEQFRVWVAAPNGSFAQHLIAQGLLGSDVVQRMRALLAKHQDEDPDYQQISSLFSSDQGLLETLDHIASQSSIGTTFSLFSIQRKLEHSGDRKPARMKSGADRFRIVRKHAKGGLGIVFVAEDTDIRREVAYKQIRQDFADNAFYQKKFKQEAAITGQLEHPGIVPIYALGSDAEGRPYYAMRFIQGESLQNAIREFHQESSVSLPRFNSTDFKQLLRRFIDICNAIDYAHSRGVLHRDLKPGNVMLGKYGETLVVDWGLATPVDTATNHDGKSSNGSGANSGQVDAPLEGSHIANRRGVFEGTIAYAPPEQLRGEIDLFSPRTDVYSLGAVLFELLTGRPPINNAISLDDAERQIESGFSQQLDSLAKQCPQALQFICLKSLAFDPFSRYATAAELRDQIQLWLDDQPIAGFAEPLGERLGRWLRQHRTLATSTMIGLLASAIILMVLYASTAQALKKEEELRQAESKLLAQERSATIQRLNSTAELARRRGQFHQAAAAMNELREKQSLTASQSLLLLQDLASSEQVKLALLESEKLQRELLDPKAQAIFDLTVGDLKIMTREEKQGFQLIEQSLSSGALPEELQLYAQALTAKHVTECQEKLRSCLQVNPLNLNALTKLAVTSVLAGDLSEAGELVDYGLALWPDDLRLTFVASLREAITNSDSDQESHIDRFMELGGSDVEVAVIRLVHSVYRDLAGGIETEWKAIDLLSRLGEWSGSYAKLLLQRSKETEMVCMPRIGWMGSFYESMPGTIGLAISNLVPGNLTQKLKRMADELPNHFWLQLWLAESLAGDGKFKEAANQYLRASQLDSPAPGMTKRALWASLMFAQAANVFGESISEDSLANGRHQLLSNRADLSNLPKWFSKQQAFAGLLRVELFDTAADFAQQELAASPPDEQPSWQQRVELAERLKQEIAQQIGEAIDTLSQPVQPPPSTN